MSKALIAMGAKADLVNSMIEKEDNNLAEEVLMSLDKSMESSAQSDDDLISNFSVSNGMMLEAKKKIIRDGKVTWVNKKIKKKRMSSKQRQALKKARRKSNSGQAKRNRAKSMKQRKSRGM